MGDLDKACIHLEAALSDCRDSGYRPELAWSCHDYAGVLLERNAAGDRTKAIGLLEESNSIANTLPMRPLLSRTNSLRESADSLGPVSQDGLTQREIEVIRLVAAGRTDREIAEELIIGVRTVSTHVGNILNKTGAANRAEAASYAVLHDLN